MLNDITQTRIQVDKNLQATTYEQMQGRRAESRQKPNKQTAAAVWTNLPGEHAGALAEKNTRWQRTRDVAGFKIVGTHWLTM